MKFVGRGKSRETKVFENGSNYWSIFLWNLKNEQGRAKKTCIFNVICKIGQKQGLWALIASFFRFHIKEKWNRNLNYLQQLILGKVSEANGNGSTKQLASMNKIKGTICM